MPYKDKEKNKKAIKNWQISHPEKVKGYKKKYCLTHRQQEKEYRKKWREKNPDKEAEIGRKSYVKTKEKQLLYAKQYRQTPEGKKANTKGKFKRRHLGFIPLNSYFKGAEGHHIDRERVIYIPQKLHESIGHSILKNRNMNAINAKAFEFLESRCLGN